MSKLICSTSRFSIGCTFLDWSILYLSGQTKFLHHTLGWLDVEPTPLTGVNSHGHKKNHPIGYQQTVECVDFLQKNTDFATVYPFPMHRDQAAAELKLDISKLDHSDHHKILQHRNSDYNQLLKWMDQQGAKIIFVALNPSIPLSKNTYTRSLSFSKYQLSSTTQLQELVDSLYFRDSTARWNQLNLTNLWDIRERLALDTRPFAINEGDTDFDFEHRWVDSMALWFDGKETIPELCRWAGVDVLPSRVDSWIDVYLQWQKLQFETLRFQNEHSHIVDCIVNNWSLPIDLTFDQEVVIQHCLIYQHNLNLKTWQLTKFPNNTKQLHALLEPNIHPVEKIY